MRYKDSETFRICKYSAENLGNIGREKYSFHEEQLHFFLSFLLLLPHFVIYS
jgi:hypothetical protein